MKYRNVRTGKVLVRPTPDEWLEASKGWERVEDDELEPTAPAADDIESEDDR